ncbi:hypothetical protein [Haloactinomyces albus]|uniref:Lipase (Class 3) n=1 Tax=Haloactinomyces albus TaxID=1352928 RepID=A0AAE3ZCR1_9ACTN|nr:hypothetical protein [Haloactinomyces albus]MDR7301291.1 hypothetical protein [Haloactinomyces albus]
MQAPGPDTRVVELRVHGILGTTPHDLTDSVASVDVAGDGVGRIVRPADRLLRPVSGPALTAGEHSVSRVVEGYAWGEMTSGGAKATWALLFPFALANMAHWMLPPSRSDSPLSRGLAFVLRALMRVAALLLTMLFVAQSTVIGLDLFAAQCLRVGSGCMGYVPDVVRHAETARSILALLAVSSVILAMQWLSTVSWRVLAPRPEDPHDSARAPVLPGSNVVTDPDTPALRALHVVAALSTVVLLALGGPLAVDTDPRRLAAAGLLVLCLLGTVALDDPTGTGSHGSRALRSALGRRPRRLLVAAAAVLVAATALAPPPLDGPLPGSGPTIDALTAGLLLTCTALGLLLIPAARAARQTGTRLPRHLRPWAGGWMAAPTLLVACLLGIGFGAGLTLSLRQALGDPRLVLPPAYTSVALFWGATTVLTVLAALVIVPYAWLRWWRATRTEKGVSPEVALLHAGRPQDQQRAAGAWQWAELQRRYGHRLLLFVAAVLTVGTCVSLALRLLGVPHSFEWSRWLSGLGVGALAALAAAALRTVHLAVRRPQAARRLGVLCDLTLFWPRAAHPVVPPCYAVKVVPELVRRATEHLADPDTRVVLVGHSQGSLLATVAAARLMDSLPESDRERIGLVTAGSQLQWAYSRAFPGTAPHDAQRKLAGALGGRWRSLCRGTDPLGGAVSTWNRQVHDGKLLGVGFRSDGTEGPLPAATRGPTGALVLGGDHWMPDPQRGPFGLRRWVPGVLQHSEYSGDPEWDRAVAMAAGLEIPVRGAQLPLCTPATTATPSLEPHPVPGTVPDGTVPDDDGASLDVAGGQHEEASHPVNTPAPAEPVNGHTSDVATEPPQQTIPGTIETSRNIEPRRSITEPPEATDPRGKTPPWERAAALHPLDH